MIAFNGQYLPAASHGNMRITAACLGGQWVMGGWLKTATQQAIIAAFGAEEGIAVISRTNDYLNALALTDQTRAQQLAMFIQEDPLLVTSLVETSKTRWLVGDGKACVDSDVNLSLVSSPSVSIYFKYVESGGNYNTIFGGWYSNTKNTGIWINNNCIHSRWGQISGTTYNTAPCLVGTEHLIYADMEKFQYDNNTIYTDINKITYDGNNPIFATYRASYYEMYGKINISHLKIKDGTTPIREMYPFTRNGENGMLDIISGTFHPNANTAGAFTIAITDKQ